MARKILNFIRETKTELSRVVWPTRAEALRKTALVVGCMVVGAAIIGAFDLALSEGVKILLSI